ncbi:chromosomal replication initiation protein DnaA [Moraxella osloensis]|uniref:Chromosomal replication initiator protein DnaA n=1 Tax=Faucicola osloensis TaxID=34062 RepID=A0A378Q7T1_FAUOS|nr:chromosomal replication initiator protein DnaA [Moraxella osloensis]AME01574.1 chromosomal replication initiation protein DnaA [Moraxella osloensis]OBX54317.1 chromosomal replication initiation protein DnaA [Moraxella osloensis]QPT42695.1 chromosomal replication initiator protein DnaA [Moraxella osloensis]STY96258.1 Chromosomal replication initiator protein DnaA [Moraxella osloensis]
MADALWLKCVDELKYQVPDNIFTMWIRPLSASMHDNTMVVNVPNQYFASYVEKNHLNQIQTILHQLEPTLPIHVQIQIDKGNAITDAVGTQEFGEQKVTLVKNEQQRSFQYIDPHFTFDQFVTAKSNQIAYSICRETANNLGQSKNNPLFIYGATGLGKTHLMQAIAHEILKQGKSFYYFTSDKFVNQLVNSLRKQKIDEFKDKIKKADLLIIDDIHVIAGKQKSSEQFLLLLNDFMSKNKQVILASDKHPSALTDFDERLKSRLAWGVAVALEPPELETRIQILQKKSKAQEVNLPKECAIFIAQHIIANVRELEGALNKVLAISRLLNQPIHLELVQMALKDLIAIRVQAVSMDNIRKVVAEFYDISVKDLMGKKRLRHIARPRQVAMSLARELTNNSFTEIGQSFGGRDHTTVMHACEKVQELCVSDLMFDKDYRSLKLMLQT